VSCMDPGDNMFAGVLYTNEGPGRIFVYLMYIASLVLLNNNNIFLCKSLMLQLFDRAVAPPKETIDVMYARFPLLGLTFLLPETRRIFVLLCTVHVRKM
jgi:hypothetical protein